MVENRSVLPGSGGGRACECKGAGWGSLGGGGDGTVLCPGFVNLYMHRDSWNCVPRTSQTACVITDK